MGANGGSGYVPPRRGGITPPPPSGVMVGNTLVVSTEGNDATGLREDWAFHFRTIQGARTASLSGDVIVVFPDNYTVIGAAWADGRSMFCHPNVILTSSGSPYVSVTNFRLTGYADIVTTNTGGGFGSDVFFQFNSWQSDDEIQFAGTDITFEGYNDITALGIPSGSPDYGILRIAVTTANATIKIKFRNLILPATAGTFCMGIIVHAGDAASNSNFYIECDSILKETRGKAFGVVKYGPNNGLNYNVFFTCKNIIDSSDSPESCIDVRNLSNGTAADPQYGIYVNYKSIVCSGSTPGIFVAASWNVNINGQYLQTQTGKLISLTNATTSTGDNGCGNTSITTGVYRVAGTTSAIDIESIQGYSLNLLYPGQANQSQGEININGSEAAVTCVGKITGYYNAAGIVVAASIYIQESEKNVFLWLQDFDLLDASNGDAAILFVGGNLVPPPYLFLKNVLIETDGISCIDTDAATLIAVQNNACSSNKPLSALCTNVIVGTQIIVNSNITVFP